MNNNLCVFDSSSRICQGTDIGTPPVASSGFCYLGYQTDPGSTTASWGVFQAVDLSLLDWENDTCNFILSWPSSGFENKNNGTVKMTWFSIDNFTNFSTAVNNICINGTSYWPSLASYIHESSFSSGQTPSSINVTLTDSRVVKKYIIALTKVSSLGSDNGKKWVYGGICYQPTITISDNNILLTGTHLVNGHTYTIGHNNYSNSTTWTMLYRQIDTGTPSFLSISFTNTVNDTITQSSPMSGTAQVRYTASMQLSGYTSCVPRSLDYTLTELPTLQFSYNSHYYTTNQTFTVARNSNITLNVIVDGIEYARDYQFKASLNGSTAVVYPNNYTLSITNITTTQTYVLTPFIDNIEGSAITVIFQVPTDPLSTFTISKNSNNFATIDVTYVGNTSGTFSSKVTIGSKVIGYTNIKTIASGSGSFTFNMADLCTINETVTDPTSFICYVKFTPASDTLPSMERSILLTYIKTTPNYYNQHGNSNINNTSKICRNIRGIIPKSSTNGLSETTWTWSVTSTKGVLNSPTVGSSSSYFTIDTGFVNLPTSNSSVDVNFVATLQQTNTQNNTLTYIYTYTITAQEISYPTTLSSINLNPSTLNFFNTIDSTSISFIKPESISTENFFTLPAAWVLKQSSTLLTSSSSSYSFTWGTVKNTLTAAANQRYGIKIISNLTLTFTNQFNETFVFPVIFSINYDAQVTSFSISGNSSITIGSTYTVTVSIGRTTYEKLYLDVYFNGNSVVTNQQVNEGVSSISINFICPVFSGNNASLYVQARHARTGISNITSNTLVLTSSYHVAPSITFTAATYNDTTDEITYTYTITDWGVSSGTLTSLSVIITDGTHTYTAISPNLSAALPQTITDTISISSWGLSADTEIWLSITSNQSSDVVTSTSNHLILILGRYPTVAYRPHQIGINTSNPRSSSVVDIHTITGKPNVTIVSSSGIITINAINGTIDFEFLS